MLYRKATYWTDKTGQIWHSYSAENGRDLTMGILKPWEVSRSLAWAKMHNMTIDDQRAQ